MASANPEPGDLIEIFRDGYQHWAVYVGNGYVVHLAPASKYAEAGSASVASALTDKSVVERELLSVVARGQKFRVNNKHDDSCSPLPPSKIVQRAEELVGQVSRYTLTSMACEFFVNELRYGIPYNDQANPEPGDLIEIFHDGYQRWAVYVGNGYVVHLDPPSEKLGPGSASVASALTDKAEVKRELLSVVAGGQKYRVNKKHDDEYSPLPPSKIVQRAEKLVGQEVSYILTSEDCESLFNKLRYDVNFSNQVSKEVKIPNRGVGLVGLFRAAGLAGLFRAAVLVAFRLIKSK